MRDYKGPMEKKKQLTDAFKHQKAAQGKNESTPFRSFKDLGLKINSKAYECYSASNGGRVDE